MMSTKHSGCCQNGCFGLCCTKIENFGVTFGKTQVLKDVNLHIHCGELTAIIGPNGAGKSTLLKSILGEVKHTGELKFMDATGEKSDKPLVGYVPQHLSFDTGSPVSVLDLFMASLVKAPSWLYKPKGIRKKVEDCLAKVKAEHLIDRRLGALSGGELQRVLLALALQPVPHLLLLDEPVSGIDQNGLEMFYSILLELKQNFDLSIILVSHDLDLVLKYADRVVLVKGTVLASGTPSEMSRNEMLLKTFGMSWFNDFTDKNGRGGGNR
ncbi:MAG: metal ABC transporter ATP-binding protein [Clostridiaceae bacterium]|jgi:zinc transport system ATP-binding protein|nr:metal ABC transporter ATP-binding protein [Clostridiaceae bacterium]